MKSSLFSSGEKACSCSQYFDLELDRDAIAERIRLTRKLKAELSSVAESYDSSSKLCICETCGQFWQSSRAWNWGNLEYLFKVPHTDSDRWKIEPYVKPDEILIYNASFQNYIEKNPAVETGIKCMTQSCERSAVKYSVLCERHHIVSLQKVGALPPHPKGRPFPPYGP